MAVLEGTPAVSGGKQVTRFRIDQITGVLLSEGYGALTITIEDGENLAEVIGVLGFAFPDKALSMSTDGRSVSFAPAVEVKPKKGKADAATA